MSFTPVKGRCRNCGKPYTKRQAHQHFCKAYCRGMYHALGNTPQVRIQKIIRREIKLLVKKLVQEEVSNIMHVRTR